jgi:hypothetical protein
MNTSVKRTLALCVIAAFCGVPSLANSGDGPLDPICPNAQFSHFRMLSRPCPRPVGLINMSPVGFAPSSIRVP